MRILISPVGNQDPFSEKTAEEGSAVTLCRYLEPALVYLIPTAERHDVQSSTEQAAKDTRDWLASELPNTRVLIKPLDVSDPTDYAQVLPKLRDVVLGILNEIASIEDAELFFNASSATPQIKSAGLILIASQILPARPFQVADPRFQTRAERIQEIAVAFLTEDPTIDKIRSLFERHLFATAEEELQRLARSTVLLNRRHVAEILAQVCAAYACLDRLAYDKGVAPLRQALRAIRGLQEFQQVQPLLEAQAAMLETLRDGTGLAAAVSTPPTGRPGSRPHQPPALNVVERFEVLGDFYHNAVRRHDEEKYADVLARAWRIAEGCLFHRLRERHGIEPHDLGRSADRSAASMVTKSGPNTRSLSFRDAWSALEDTLGDIEFRRLLAKPVPPTVGHYGSFKALLEALRERRNASVVAHGVMPVTQEMAAEGLHVAQTLLDFAFPGQDLSGFPFAREKLRFLADAVFARLAS